MVVDFESGDASTLLDSANVYIAGWSPDGQHLALWMGDINTGMNLTMVDVDDPSNRWFIAEPMHDPVRVTFSPSGDYLLVPSTFIDGLACFGQIIQVRADGSGWHPLTSCDHGGYSPVWRPNP